MCVSRTAAAGRISTDITRLKVNNRAKDAAKQTVEWNNSLSQCPANARVSLRLIAALRCESAEQQPFITPPFYHLSGAYGVIFLQTLRIYPILHNHNKYIPFSLLLAELMALTVCICERTSILCCYRWSVVGEIIDFEAEMLCCFLATHSLSSDAAAGEEPMIKIIRESL